MRVPLLGSTPPAANNAPLSNNPGLWLPWGQSLIYPASGVTIQGVVNNQQQVQFVCPYTINIGHVSITIGAGLAGSLAGIALYSGDGSTKLTAADGFSTAVAGTLRIALSQAIQLVAATPYWIGWTATDATTVTWLNYLDVAQRATAMNGGGIIRYGRNTTNATANGVTLSKIQNVTTVQLRILDMWFD